MHYHDPGKQSVTTFVQTKTANLDTDAGRGAKPYNRKDLGMKAGKLPLDLLSRLLAGIPQDDPRVVVGPRAGEDAALIDFGDRYLVAKTDPITFATDLIGWYVVQVNANDLAVMGATPRWLMATLLFPEGTQPDEVEEAFEQLVRASTELGITMVGGHTEVTYGLSRPLAVGAMLGEVEKGRQVLTSEARPGDSLVLTRGIAIEGTAILARESAQDLRNAGVEQGVIDQAAGLLFAPGISVAADARIAVQAADVHAMHDPTEGGLATGLLELATAAGVGLTVDLDRIPILDECRTLCQALGLDPIGLIASGALLVALPPQDVPSLIEALAEEGIEAAEIGRVTAQKDGLKLRVGREDQTLPVFERDELARWFSEE